MTRRRTSQAGPTAQFAGVTAIPSLNAIVFTMLRSRARLSACAVLPVSTVTSRRPWLVAISDGGFVTLIYSAAMSTPGKLYLRTVAGGEPDRALPHAFFQTATDWSTNGRYVVFGNTGFGRAAFEDNGDVLVVDMEAKPERRIHPLLVTGFHEANAAWSPDGKWLAFTSNESGNPEIYVQRFEGGDPPILTGERSRVTRNGAQTIRWRSDGKEMFYLALDGKVHAIPVSLAEKPTFGEPTALFTVSTGARAAIHATIGFDVSADGQRFVIPVVTSPEDPAIIVVQNWEP